MYDTIILVPYRDRLDHIKYFIEHCCPILKNNIPNSKVVFIEQDFSNNFFNRGLLLNIGFDLYKNQTIFYITHDIDIIPNEKIINELRNIKKFRKKKTLDIPDFDVLSKDPQTTANIVRNQLKTEGIKNVKIKKHKGVGEIIATHYDIRINGETVAFIYEPLACHSFNIIKKNGRKIRVATLDTMLSFYLAFLYVNRAYYDPQRILCMSHYLFKVQQKNRLTQKGILRRFSIDCYGDEKHTKENIRAEKTKKYKELSKKRGTEEWEYYFLNYKPGEKEEKKFKKKGKKKTRKLKRKKKRKTRKRKKRGFFNF